MAAARQPWLKPFVFAGAAAPLLWLASRALRGTLGPDPVAEVLNRLGLYAISLLFCSLACTRSAGTPTTRAWATFFTPSRRISPWPNCYPGDGRCSWPLWPCRYARPWNYSS